MGWAGCNTTYAGSQVGYNIMMSETTNSSVAQSATICLSDNCIEIRDASHALTSYVDEEILLSSGRFRVLRRILT